MMDTNELFEQCLAQATEVVVQVKPSQFGAETPDTEWDVSKLVGHMLYELSWVPDIVSGQTLTDVGDRYEGDLIGDDLAGSWKSAVAKAQDAVGEVYLNRMVHLSYGTFAAEHYLRQESNDQYIHAWDLGAAIGVAVKFDEAVAKELYEAALPRKKQLAATKLFAPPIDVPDSADIQTKLLALFGRSSSWKPTK